MNFETGVISASSPSIGGVCAAAGPNQLEASRAASVRIANRVIARLLSGICQGVSRRDLTTPLEHFATESRSTRAMLVAGAAASFAALDSAEPSCYSPPRRPPATVLPEARRNMQVTCATCYRPIALTDAIESSAGRLSHLDCARSHGLTPEERALLFTYC